MALCEHVTGATLEITLEMFSLFDRLECHVQFDLPWLEPGSVWTFSGVVIREPLS
jgi:hypothetical protein